MYRKILPRVHPLSGWDWRNRARQRALDRCFSHPARVQETLDAMLDALERRVTVTAAAAEG